ncbi:MAG: periplasmic heavy metal sensor [Acidobacteria bacterium]|nr:periplasmic heavy metal sensor [Acidobacteriota bacterium]
MQLRQTMGMLIVAGTLLAQGPGGPTPGMGMAQGQAPNFDAVKAAIGISDAQIAQLRALQQQTATAMRTAAQELQTKQTALNELLARNPDPATVGRAVIEIAAIRKRMDDLRARVLTQAVAVLSADQRTKLKTLEDAMKLQPAIGQAAGLGLLQRPEGGPGGGGPGGRGPGGFAGPRFGGFGPPSDN